MHLIGAFKHESMDKTEKKKKTHLYFYLYPYLFFVKFYVNTNFFPIVFSGNKKLWGFTFK